MLSTSRRFLVVLSSAAALSSIFELEIVGRQSGFPLEATGVIALILASFSLFLPTVAVLSVITTLVPGRVVSAFHRGARTRLRVLATLLLLLAIALHYVDTTMFVRLYPGYHLMLGLARVTLTFLATLAAFASLGSTRLSAPRGASGKGLAVVIAIIAGLAGVVVAHGTLGLREDSRAALLGKTSATARLAELLSSATDIDDDGLGWLMTHADSDPRDPAVGSVSSCGIPVADTRSPMRSVPPRQTAPLGTHTNLLLVIIDALRHDLAPSTAAGRKLSPNLARLADTSVSFERAYATASWTMPSTYSLMTGRFPWAIAWASTMITSDNKVAVARRAATWPRLWSGPFVPTPALDRHPTLAEALEEAGLTTATFPVQENLLRSFGLSRGFSVYDNRVWKQLNRSGGAITGEAEASAVLDFLAAHRQERFFVWTHLYDPHNPYRVPPGEQADEGVPYSRYMAEVSYTDRQLGRILDGLARLGLSETTAVVVTADHGEEFGDHGGEYHGSTLYEEQIRVPLVISAQGVEPRTVGTPVSLIDLTPTMSELVGVAPPETFQGRSLLPVMRGLASSARPILAETVYKGIHELYMMVTGNHKLIWNRRGGYRELYDLSADPEERSNLVVVERELALELTRTLCLNLKSSGGLAVSPGSRSE